jgi:hypothetical protein
MSEYQYYEFLAIDRPISEQQQAELRNLSSRARITATSFTNEYHWGDFRGDRRRMMERYFDAFLYLANWGTRELMIRLPANVLDIASVRRYCIGGPGDAAHALAPDGNGIVSFRSDEEPEDGWEDGTGTLASAAQVRPGLASGDTRFLYLGWLLSVQSDDVADDEIEPPVSPGLADLDGPLQEVAAFLRIDENLLAVAALDSPDLAGAQQAGVELATWIGQLTAAEKDALLLRAAQGEAMRVQADLLRGFRAENPAEGLGPVAGRSAGELRRSAAAFQDQRQRALAEKQAKEQARKAREAADAYNRHLDKLAQREDAAWELAGDLIGTRKPGEYDKAVTLLMDLRALSQREGRLPDALRHGCG